MDTLTAANPLVDCEYSANASDETMVLELEHWPATQLEDAVEAIAHKSRFLLGIEQATRLRDLLSRALDELDPPAQPS
jgi:hypothetical protein